MRLICLACLALGAGLALGAWTTHQRAAAVVAVVETPAVAVPVTEITQAAFKAWPAVPENCTPHFTSMHALDDKTAVLGGAWWKIGATEPLQSFAFLTRDGGLSWTPFGPAFAAAQTIAVNLHNLNTNFMLLQDGELSDNARLLRSSDGGNSWRESPMVLPGSGTVISADIAAIDGDHALLRLRRAGTGSGSAEANREHWLASNDGGIHWREIEGRSSSEMPAMQIQTPSGGQWRLDGDRLYRRENDSQQWKRVRTLPSGEKSGPDERITVAMVG